MSRSIKIRDIAPSEVSEHKSDYNSSRHDAAELTVAEKQAVVEATYYGPWIKTIAESAGYSWQDIHVLVLSKYYAETLIRASNCALITGRMPESELEDLLDQFPLDKDVLAPEHGWFLRLDLMSPKDSTVSTGPVYKPLEILERLATSLRTLRGLHRGIELEQVIKLYLMPFNKAMDTSREFRVFCPPGGHIAAISQYHWFEESQWTDGQLKDIAEGIQQIHSIILANDQEYREVLKSDGFIFDVFYPDSEEISVQLVELNPFGALSGSGGCLYHWIGDWEVLFSSDASGPIDFAVSRSVEG